MREGSILNALKDDLYRIGDLQVLLYDKARVNIFPEGYLSKLYQLCKLSGRRNKLGILPQLFCGMPDLSHDAITTYLASRPVLVFVIWSGESFFEAGFAFPTALPVAGNRVGPERSLFVGYGMFKGVWGKPEAEILGMLGLAYFFLEYALGAVHSVRYCWNDLTARFVRRYGFRDVGTIPRYMLEDGKLVPAVASSLLVEDFEFYVERKLVELLRAGVLTDDRQPQMPGPVRPHRPKVPNLPVRHP